MIIILLGMNFFRVFYILLSFCFFGFPSQAKVFQNSYVSFEMPENWNCKSFGTDWVCHSTLAKQQKEAMIILTAKQAGTLDNLDAYLSFLREPRNGLTKTNQSFQSDVIHTKKTFINKQAWVDSLHKESEIPEYFTRYVVTVCCTSSSAKLGILVTYSAHKNHYTKYSADFLKSINSLRVLDIKKALGEIEALGANDSFGTFNPGSYIQNLLDDDGGENIEPSNTLFGFTYEQLGIGLAVLFIIIMYLVFKMRKKSRRRKKSKRRRVIRR